MSKRLQKTLSIVLSLIFALSVFAVTASAQGEIEFLSLNGVAKGESFFINWQKSDADGKYYFYLPAGTDMSSLRTKFVANSSVYVGETKLGYDMETDVFYGGGEFTVTSGSASYQVVILQSQNIPAMFIETESGSLDAIHADKSHKEKGKIAVVENGEVTVDTTLSSIKGRGNSTWKLDKKPYNIKFDKKIDLFGLGKAKKFSLLASRYDPSFIRNSFIFDLSDDMGLYYSSKSQHVDLYVNGEYLGNYLVCESVEVGSSRVDITDLEELNEEANPGVDVESAPLAGDRSGSSAGSIKYADFQGNPDDISGGYLLEFEFLNRYEPEISGFVTKIGQPVVLKSPEYASKAQVEYISSFWQEFEDALYSDNGTNSLGKHYTEYIDIDSFAKMYIIEELSMDVDAGLSSCYFFKDAKSDKIYASPVWDFDLALGSFDESRYGVSLLDATKWFAANSYIGKKSNPTGRAFYTVFGELFRHDDFIEAVKKAWNENALPNLGEEKIAQVKALANDVAASATMDNYLWRRQLDSSYETVLDAFNKEVDYLVSFITNRTSALSKGYSDKAAYLFYDGNGAEGTAFETAITIAGEKLKIQKCSMDHDDFLYVFDGWNTEKDGSGTSYEPGDEITLGEGSTVLYAQWKKVNFVVANYLRFVELLKALVAKIMGWFK